MLDIRRIRQNPEEVKNLLARRHGDFPIDQVLELDEERRKTLNQVEQMKARQNAVSKEIPRLKKESKDATEVLKEMKELSTQIGDLDAKVKELDEKIKGLLLEIPNTPNKDVVEGKSDEDNVEIRRHGSLGSLILSPRPTGI